VVDGHGHGAISQLMLHPEAKLLAGRPLRYPFGFDGANFDAAIMVGQHAKSNTDGGHLCHTGSFAVENLTINGVSVGEAGCNMLFAAYFGAPTVMLSGDQAACEEVQALAPEMEVATVKGGIKRGSASGLTADENKLFNGACVSVSPEKSRNFIKEKARAGVARTWEISPFWLEPPYELVSVLRPQESGGKMRKARVTSDDLLELLNMPRKYED